MTTLVTGSSGFLGQELLKTIIERKDAKFILLLRDKAFARLSKELKSYDHIHLAKGHLQHPDLFVDTRELERAKNEVTGVIHVGALYDLKASKERLYKTNVIGTQNVLFFCEEAKNIKKFLYASTIAVAGDVEGPFSTADFDLGQGHPNPYAKTKFEAEGMVRKYSSNHPGIQVDVLRLGVIVGDSQTGDFTKEDGPYYFFKSIGRVLKAAPQLTKLGFVPFPFNGHAIFPLIPVDCAARAFWSSWDQVHEGLNCEYVIAENAPSMANFLEDFLKAIGSPMKVIPLPGGRLSESILKQALKAIQLPEALSDYLYLKTKFVQNSRVSKKGLCRYEEIKGPFFKKVIRTYLPEKTGRSL